MSAPIIWNSGAARLLQAGLKIPGSTSGVLTLQPAASTTSYSLTYPGAQGAANQILQNNGSGVYSWISGTDAATASTYVKRDASANSSFNGLRMADQSFVLGSQDTVQFYVKGFAGQASDVFQVIKGDNTGLLQVSGTGALLAAGAITGSNLSGTNTGNVTLTGVGATPNANGASLSGQALTLQPADATNPGLMSVTTQTFAGLKTFSSIVTADISGTSSNVTGVVAETHGGTNQSSYTTGDILYASATNTLSKQAVGSTGQVLTVAGGIPTWASPGSSSLAVTTKTANYTATTSDGLILCNTNAFTVTLPAASNTGLVLRIKKIGSDLNIITIAAGGGDTIQGDASTTLNTQYEIVTLVAVGSNTWEILDRDYFRGWINFTMNTTSSGSAPTKATSPAVDLASYRRNGSSIDIVYTYAQTSSTGAVTGTGRYQFPIPNSSTWTIDSTFVNESPNNGQSIVGACAALDGSQAGNDVAGDGVVHADSSTAVSLSVYTNGNGTVQVGAAYGGFAAAATIRHSFSATVPITGWK